MKYFFILQSNLKTLFLTHVIYYCQPFTAWCIFWLFSGPDVVGVCCSSGWSTTLKPVNLNNKKIYNNTSYDLKFTLLRHTIGAKNDILSCSYYSHYTFISDLLNLFLFWDPSVNMHSYVHCLDLLHLQDKTKITYCIIYFNQFSCLCVNYSSVGGGGRGWDCWNARGHHPYFNLKVNIIFNTILQKLINFRGFRIIHDNEIINTWLSLI